MHEERHVEIKWPAELFSLHHSSPVNGWIIAAASNWNRAASTPHYRPKWVPDICLMHYRRSLNSYWNTVQKRPPWSLFQLCRVMQMSYRCWTQSDLRLPLLLCVFILGFDEQRWCPGAGSEQRPQGEHNPIHRYPKVSRLTAFKPHMSCSATVHILHCKTQPQHTRHLSNIQPRGEETLQMRSLWHSKCYRNGFY